MEEEEGEEVTGGGRMGAATWVKGDILVALFDYEAVQKDDLSFKEGDVLTFKADVGGGWVRGKLDGKKGIFPEGYVRREKSPAGGALSGAKSLL